MYKIRVYSVGRTKEVWLQEALAEYEKRLKPSLSLEWIFAKTDRHLTQFLEKETGFICLDPKGRQLSSEEFSSHLVTTLSAMHSRLCFVIGGAEGIPAAIQSRALSSLSLSRMTFTHQLTRLILVEQIYRALEISRGSAYHRP